MKKVRDMGEPRLSKDDLTLLLGVLNSVKLEGKAVDAFVLLRGKLRGQLAAIEGKKNGAVGNPD